MIPCCLCTPCHQGKLPAAGARLGAMNLCSSRPQRSRIFCCQCLLLHPCSDMQRHAARAYWHLVAISASRKQFLAADGVGALLHLSRMATKSVQGKSLAQQALKRLADDPQVGRARHGSINNSKCNLANVG